VNDLGKEKQKLTLSVDKDAIEKARVLGINISEFTENVLTGYTSAEKPEGSIYDAYKQLFDSIIPLLKEFECKVRIAECVITIEDENGEVVNSHQTDATYLTAGGSFLVEEYTGPEDSEYFLDDITKIPADELLRPEKILSNLLKELATSQEKRKKRLDEILMAKRIVEAMSESLLKRTPDKDTSKSE
jgi:hypothetical protein